MRIIDVQQGSPEWLQARLGIPTCSCFDQIITPKTRKASASQDRYMARLLAELATGQPIDAQASAYMDRGKDLEAEAIRWYEFERGVDVRRVGLILTDDGKVGGSPDGLVGDDGLIEVKCYDAEHHMLAALDDGVQAAADHACQIQGLLGLTDRKWCDLILYNPIMPKVVYRVGRDEVFIADIALHVSAFVARLETAGRKLLAEIGQ